MQLRPDLLAAAPDHATEAAPRVAQRHDEQARAPVAIGARHARERPLAVVDLRFLAGPELEPVELRRFAGAELGDETLDAVVLAGKPELIDQILVDRNSVAAQPLLRF